MSPFTYSRTLSHHASVARFGGDAGTRGPISSITERRFGWPFVVATIIAGLVAGWLIAIPLIQAVSQ